MVAGASGGFGIYGGNGDTNATGGSGGGGNINITTATPSLGGGLSITNGAISAGSIASGAVQASTITMGTIESPGATINVTSGKTALTGSITDNGLGANLGGTINLTTNSATAFKVDATAVNGVNGTISAVGGPTAGEVVVAER